MTTIDHIPPQMFQPAAAEALAAKLNAEEAAAGDPGAWTYAVEHSAGLSRVTVTDEDGILLGYL